MSNKTVHKMSNRSTAYTACDEKIQIDMDRCLYVTSDNSEVTCAVCKLTEEMK
jgi:hypothetical protein